MHIYNVLIADDNDFQRTSLKEQLLEVNKQFDSFQFNVVKECNQRAETIEAIISIKPDIVFLDIEFEDGFENSEEAGFEIALQLHLKKYYSSAIIFFSNWDNEINTKKAFKSGGFTVIPKSATRESLTVLQSELNNYNRTITLSGKKGVELYTKSRFISTISFKVDGENLENFINFLGYVKNKNDEISFSKQIKDILFLSSISTVDDLCCLHITGSISKIFIKKRLSEVLEFLPQKHFKRITSREAININYFDTTTCLKKTEYSKTTIFIQKKELIEVTTTRSDSKLFKEFLKSIGKDD